MKKCRKNLLLFCILNESYSFTDNLMRSRTLIDESTKINAEGRFTDLTKFYLTYYTSLIIDSNYHKSYMSSINIHVLENTSSRNSQNNRSTEVFVISTKVTQVIQFILSKHELLLKSRPHLK